jgi:hypothetical protein
MLSDLGHLRDHSKKPHYIEQAKTPIHMTIEQLESEIA